MCLGPFVGFRHCASGSVLATLPAPGMYCCPRIRVGGDIHLSRKDLSCVDRTITGSVGKRWFHDSARHGALAAGNVRGNVRGGAASSVRKLVRPRRTASTVVVPGPPELRAGLDRQRLDDLNVSMSLWSGEMGGRGTCIRAERGRSWSASRRITGRDGRYRVWRGWAVGLLSAGEGVKELPMALRALGREFERTLERSLISYMAGGRVVGTVGTWRFGAGKSEDGSERQASHNKGRREYGSTDGRRAGREQRHHHLPHWEVELWANTNSAKNLLAPICPILWENKIHADDLNHITVPSRTKGTPLRLSPELLPTLHDQALTHNEESIGDGTT
ncbi:hypothetical protein FB45DRAFT_1109061 [Roridomyces roridus]|uniref:Uncharacterized protein n=1 Tax=Roridomyces roridus TaxID=1738132 RepID=A0AAD7FE49_9AGAR|nr:hypothetical protein FB45DRAFT_1109061 [Roridomyces roridus]